MLIFAYMTDSPTMTIVLKGEEI